MSQYTKTPTTKGPGRRPKHGKPKPHWTLDMESVDRDVKACVPPQHQSPIGRAYAYSGEVIRRVWLGGISAMRGW